MDDKVNLSEKLALLEGPYRPGIVGYVIDYKLQIVKVQGEFVWHTGDVDSTLTAGEVEV